MSEIKITGQKRLVIVTGRAHPQLAIDIAEELGADLVHTDARTFAEQVYGMLQKHSAERCDVVVDDAKGLKGDSVVDYFKSANLRARLPDKRSRVEGWDIIRQHLADAELNTGRPGLYITTACPHLFETLSEAPRGTLNPRDLDPKWNRDHWCDGLAYGMKEVAGGPRSSQGAVVGMW